MLSRLKTWLSSLETKKESCLCCGKCCESFGAHLHAFPNDIKRWQQERRTDLLARVNRLGWIWVDPETKSSLDRCPFLEQSGELWICSINDTKPQICRDYPPAEHFYRCVRHQPREKS